MTVKQCAAMFGVSRTTIMKFLAAEGVALSGGSWLTGQAASRGKLPHGSRASSLAATSVRSSPATSGGANGAPKPPDLRLTQPVVSPARLAP
jgi:hypothetical protein